MAENYTWLKFYRSFRDWEWYRDANTARVFIDILLTATAASMSYKGISLNRGQLLTTYKVLADHLGLTERQVRTAMNHLKSTGEVSVLLTSNYQLVTVLNYDKYQGTVSASASPSSQADDSPRSGQRQQKKNTSNSTVGEYKNERKNNFKCNGNRNGYDRIPGITEL